MVTSSLQHLKKQLITHEDPGHVHKILGVACLASTLWRFSMFGQADMGFAIYPQYTVPTLLLHFSLTASSFLFKIPAKRIKTGDRIWPEYRLHAFVFLCRSLAVMLLTWYEQVHNLEPNYDINFAIVMLTLVAAQASSWGVGENHSNSIRDLETHSAVKFFFSLMQFGMTAFCLLGQRRFSTQFVMVSFLQITPFLMTLRRKNLFGTKTGVTSYGAELVFGWMVMAYEGAALVGNLDRCHGMMVDLAALLRAGPRLPLLRYIQDNKYLVWLTIGFLLRWLRPIFEQEDENFPPELIIIEWINKGAMVSVFVWKGFLRDKLRVDVKKKTV